MSLQLYLSIHLFYDVFVQNVVLNYFNSTDMLQNLNNKYEDYQRTMWATAVRRRK